jgi:hypothetical protein
MKKISLVLFCVIALLGCQTGSAVTDSGSDVRVMVDALEQETTVLVDVTPVDAVDEMAAMPTDASRQD